MHKIYGLHSPISYVSQRLSLTKGSGNTWEWKHVCMFVICPTTQTASDIAKSTLADRAERESGMLRTHVGAVFDWPWRDCTHWLDQRFDDSVDVSEVRTEKHVSEERMIGQGICMKCHETTNFSTSWFSLEFWNGTNCFRSSHTVSTYDTCMKLHIILL